MRKLFCLGLVVTLFASCAKDDPTTSVAPVDKANYFPLQIGNYWIYEHFEIDSSGNETKRNSTDSVVISGDTVIGGNQYYIMEDYAINGGMWESTDYLRDSSGYIVNREGKIIFSADNFTDTLASIIHIEGGDTLFVVNYQMEKLTSQVVVPAGTFEVLNFKGTIIEYYQYPGIKNPRYSNNYFADNVGKISETTLYFHSPIISEKRLVRYKVK